MSATQCRQHMMQNPDSHPFIPRSCPTCGLGPCRWANQSHPPPGPDENQPIRPTNNPVKPDHVTTGPGSFLAFDTRQGQPQQTDTREAMIAAIVADVAEKVLEIRASMRETLRLRPDTSFALGVLEGAVDRAGELLRRDLRDPPG